MKTSKTLQQKVLIIGGVVLLIMALSLLLLMKKPDHLPRRESQPRHHGANPGASNDPERNRAAASRRTSRRTSPESGTSISRRPGTSATDASGSASNVSLSPRIARKKAPSRIQADAPPVIPSEIQNERDPARKAQLMKMHRLAMARVKVSQLRRRQRLLRSTVSRAHQDGSLSPEKLKRAQQNLRDLDTGIVEARKALNQAQTAANP